MRLANHGSRSQIPRLVHADVDGWLKICAGVNRNNTQKVKGFPNLLLEEDTEAADKPRKGQYSQCTHAEEKLECLSLHVRQGSTACCTHEV